jgi:hypothetical protein
MTEGRTGADGVADERMTLRQAAARLGVSESAIRKRVERGTLRSDKGPDGRRYVYLDSLAYYMADTGADTSATHERDALISEMRAHNETLREQLEAERRAHAEARRIIAGLVERIPALEPPPEPPESPETPSRPVPGNQTSPEPQTAPERVPWWRRMFGG